MFNTEDVSISGTRAQKSPQCPVLKALLLHHVSRCWSAGAIVTLTTSLAALVWVLLINGSLVSQETLTDPEKAVEQESDTGPTGHMDEIVVVATRIPTAKFNAPYRVQTVPALSGTSVRSPRTVTDALDWYCLHPNMTRWVEKTAEQCFSGLKH